MQSSFFNCKILQKEHSCWQIPTIDMQQFPKSNKTKFPNNKLENI